MRLSWFVHRPRGAGRAVPVHRGARSALLVLVLAAAVLGGLSGCSRSAGDKLAQVQTLIDRQDRAGALVAVKALLQDKPDLGEARLLHGQLLLERGDAAAAEIELRRAAELLRQDRVVPLLARAMLQANQAAKLVAQFGSTRLADATAMANLKTVLAEAQASLGELPAARDSLGQALAAVPGHAPALLLRARVAAVSGDIPAALAELKDLLARHPNNADAWVLQGDLLVRQRAEPGAVADAYRRALAAKPDHVAAHAALITLHLAMRDMEAARSQHAAMQKLLPRHPQTLLFDGQMALLQGDAAKARELFQQLLRGAPNHVLLLQSAAAAELKLNAPGQAEALLMRALQLAPGNATARRLAAQAYLALGQPARVLAVLEPLTGGKPPDAGALTLAAQARLMDGDVAQAAALFERAAVLQPDDPKIRTALALANLQRGQDESALAELQRVAAGDARGRSADLALIAAQVQRRAYDPALQAIDGLARKLPGEPLPAQLRGQVLLHKRDLPGARAAFEQALALAADYFPAVSALASLDLAEGKAEAAQARFDALLRRDPRNAQAYIALADLRLRSGAGRDAVTAQLEAGIRAMPADANLRLALAAHHLASANPKAAAAAAQAGLAQLPDNLDLLARLGQALLLTGDSQQALSTYNRMVALQGRSPASHLGLAEAQLAANDLPAAARSLARVLELEPEHLPARRLQMTLAMRQRKPEQALAVARALQKQRPALAAGFLWEGELHMAQQQWQPAVAALRQAVGKDDPQQAPMRLHHALLRAGQPADAAAMAASWLQAHPRDVLFLFHLGDEALTAKDYATAELRYRAVLAASPAHALALNNVAWLMLQQKKPGALPLAEQAVKAAPDRPALRDTLAQVLAAEGRLPQALDMQKSALALRPDDPGLRLNLARLYARANEKKLARTELDRLALLGDRFGRQAEVSEALRALGGR